MTPSLQGIYIRHDRIVISSLGLVNAKITNPQSFRSPTKPKYYSYSSSESDDSLSSDFSARRASNGGWNSCQEERQVRTTRRAQT